MILSLISGRGVSAQSVAVDSARGLIITLEMELRDLQEIDRCFQERDVLREMEAEKDKTIAELKKSLALSQKELDVERKENDLNKRIIDVQKREIDALNRNFDQMKDVADRAIRLVETAKPRTNWLYAVGAVVAAFVIGLAVGL